MFLQSTYHTWNHWQQYSCFHLILRLFNKAVPSALLMKLEWVMNGKKVTIYYYEWHYETHCDLFEWIMNDKKGHNIVNNSFAHKPDDLLVNLSYWLLTRTNQLIGLRLNFGTVVQALQFLTRMSWWWLPDVLYILDLSGQSSIFYTDWVSLKCTQLPWILLES